MGSLKGLGLDGLGFVVGIVDSLGLDTRLLCLAVAIEETRGGEVRDINMAA